MLRIHYLSKPIYLSRGLATQVSNATFAKHTKLNNGISIYTNSQQTENNNNNNNRITLLVKNSGVTSETPYNNGVSYIWSHYYQNDPTLNKWANSNGTILSSKLDRDFQTFSLNGQLSLTDSLQFLYSNILNSQTNIFDSNNLSILKRQVIDKISYQENKQQHKAVIEHLYSTAFQNTPLGLPLLGTEDTVSDLTKDDLFKFAKEKFNNTDNLSVLVSGPQVTDQSHESIVETVDQVFSLVSSRGKYTHNSSSLGKSKFIGSEVRLRDDTLPHAWISIAVESEPIDSPDQLVSQVAASIFGQYNAFEPRSRLQGIKVLDTLQEYGLCDNFRHFQLSHRDSGLWGMVTRTSNVSGIDDLIHFLLKQWNRLSVSVTETELERGKAMLKLSLAERFSGTENWADFIVNYPNYQSLDQIFADINKVTVRDLKRWANKRLWDQDVAIAGMGQIEDLLDYMRIRNDMSMMRW